jgi:ribose transport system substrate-binding protein
MKNKKLWVRRASVIPVAALVVGLAACSSGGNGGANVAGVSVFSLSNQFLATEADLVQQALTESGWMTKPTTDAGASIDQQVTDINNLLSAGATGLIIDPADSAGIVPALNAAEEAGVPVVLVDVGASGGKAYMTVRVDNSAAAAQACEQMGKLLVAAGKPNATILELQGIMAQQAGQQRSEGFNKCMAEKFPTMKIVSQPTDWVAEKAADATQTVTASQQVDAIYMHSDCALLTGVLSALSQGGLDKPVGDAGHIVLGAIDGCPAALEAIGTGIMDFTVEQPLVKYAELSVRFLNDARDGVVPTEGADKDGGVITKINTGYEYIIPATLVTLENVKENSLWGNRAK